jgi:outer membrane protein OmpA-like peptidoglycan-associated protein
MKSILILLLFITTFISSQNTLIFNLGCYKNGDTIPVEELRKIKVIDIYNQNNDKQTNKLFKWTLAVKSGDNFKTFDSNTQNKRSFTEEMKTEMLSNNAGFPKKIIINNVIIANYDKPGTTDYISILGTTFYIGKTGKPCGTKSLSDNKSIAYQGKLLMGKTSKEPLVNQEVILKDSKNNNIQSTITDKYGDFNFKPILSNENYNIEIPDHDNKIKDGTLFISKQDGSNIKSLKKIKNNFVYELLPVELTKLSEEKIDDTEITLKNFTNSKQLALTVIKDIYYDLNSIQISSESKQILDQIINSMNTNKTLKLTIISHTDSQGDDNDNQQLSEKRAKNVLSYFISRGVEKNRLISKGLGETKILNRCKNGIDCSELEHKLNRRTEFNFTK